MIRFPDGRIDNLFGRRDVVDQSDALTDGHDALVHDPVVDHVPPLESGDERQELLNRGAASFHFQGFFRTRRPRHPLRIAERPQEQQGVPFRMLQQPVFHVLMDGRFFRQQKTRPVCVNPIMAAREKSVLEMEMRLW